MGKNFFTQVAPCTNNRLFFGRFKDGVSAGELDTEFNYTFTYKMKPTNVVIRLLRDGSSTNWVFVAKRAV
jgi:photoactive yellow protein